MLAGRRGDDADDPTRPLRQKDTLKDSGNSQTRVETGDGKCRRLDINGSWIDGNYVNALCPEYAPLILPQS